MSGLHWDICVVAAYMCLFGFYCQHNTIAVLCVRIDSKLFTSLAINCFVFTVSVFFCSLLFFQSVLYTLSSCFVADVYDRLANCYYFTACWIRKDANNAIYRWICIAYRTLLERWVGCERRKREREILDTGIFSHSKGFSIVSECDKQEKVCL